MEQGAWGEWSLRSCRDETDREGVRGRRDGWTGGDDDGWMDEGTVTEGDKASEVKD